jgi:hypothetical protein
MPYDFADKVPIGMRVIIAPNGNDFIGAPSNAIKWCWWRWEIHPVELADVAIHSHVGHHEALIHALDVGLDSHWPVTSAFPVQAPVKYETVRR